MKSIRSQVNSYSSQLVLILVNSYSFFGQFVLIEFFFGQFVLIWSIRSHFGQCVLTVKLTNYEGNIERKTNRKHPNITEKKYNIRNSHQFTLLDFNL